MKRLHEGLDYKLYKIYVWGGLALLVIYILVAVLVFDVPALPGSRPFLVIVGPMFAWILGILLYWWWVFLVKGNKEFKEELQSQGQGIPEISALRSWSTLHQAMSIRGGDVEQVLKDQKKANWALVIWYGSMNLGVFWVFWLYHPGIHGNHTRISLSDHGLWGRLFGSGDAHRDTFPFRVGTQACRKRLFSTIGINYHANARVRAGCDCSNWRRSEADPKRCGGC